jgi:hypothetical protein
VIELPIMVDIVIFFVIREEVVKEDTVITFPVRVEHERIFVEKDDVTR